MSTNLPTYLAVRQPDTHTHTQHECTQQAGGHLHARTLACAHTHACARAHTNNKEFVIYMYVYSYLYINITNSLFSIK